MNSRLALASVVLTTIVAAGCGGGSEGGPARPAVKTWGGPGRTRGRFHKPRAVALEGEKVYVVDMSGRIQVFRVDGQWLATWRLPKVSRGYPTGLGIRQDGAVAVADTHNYVVRMFSADGEEIGTVGREGSGPGEFTYLTDVEFDADGYMYVSERGPEDRVQKFDAEGRFVGTWGRSGERPGEFRRPQALAVDVDGAVYVADAANHRVQKFSPDGRVLAVFGEPGREPGQLLYPYDLALAPDGRLLVCEYGNNRVQAFDRNGKSVGIWGRAGRGPGDLATPWAVAWVPGSADSAAGSGGASGRILVADTDNDRIQLFPVTGWKDAPTR